MLALRSLATLLALSSTPTASVTTLPGAPAAVVRHVIASPPAELEDGEGTREGVPTRPRAAWVRVRSGYEGQTFSAERGARYAGGLALEVGAQHRRGPYAGLAFSALPALETAIRDAAAREAAVATIRRFPIALAAGMHIARGRIAGEFEARLTVELDRTQFTRIALGDQPAAFGTLAREGQWSPMLALGPRARVLYEVVPRVSVALGFGFEGLLLRRRWFFDPAGNGDADRVVFLEPQPLRVTFDAGLVVRL